MNIYARYFDNDVLVYSFDELMNFLSSIPDIPITQRLVDDLRTYVESDMPYPKRYKIRPRVYFILIKTSARTMAEFKSRRKGIPELPAGDSNDAPLPPLDESVLSKKELKAARLAEQHAGWYLATILFKRVILIPATSKFRYQDTTFSAYVKATSGAECYQRIVDHLKARPEIDLRSQFPSARGANFTYEYVGTELPTELPA